MSENRNHLFAPAYQDHVATMVDQASKLKDDVGTFLGYASAQRRLDRLQGMVEAMEF